VVLQQQCDNATLIRFIYTYTYPKTSSKRQILVLF